MKDVPGPFLIFIRRLFFLYESLDPRPLPFVKFLSLDEQKYPDANFHFRESVIFINLKQQGSFRYILA